MEDIKAYILSIFATALFITVVDILAPASPGSGLSGHLKLVSALVFVCLLISPSVSLAERLVEFANGDWELDVEGDVNDHYSNELQGALDIASKDYFEGMLTKNCRGKDYGAWIKAFCERKYNSDFSREMTRSVKKYLEQYSKND